MVSRAFLRSAAVVSLAVHLFGCAGSASTTSGVQALESPALKSTDLVSYFDKMTTSERSAAFNTLGQMTFGQLADFLKDHATAGAFSLDGTPIPLAATQLKANIQSISDLGKSYKNLAAFWQEIGFNAEALTTASLSSGFAQLVKDQRSATALALGACMSTPGGDAGSWPVLTPVENSLHEEYLSRYGATATALAAAIDKINRRPLAYGTSTQVAIPIAGAANLYAAYDPSKGKVYLGRVLKRNNAPYYDPSHPITPIAGSSDYVENGFCYTMPEPTDATPSAPVLGVPVGKSVN